MIFLLAIIRPSNINSQWYASLQNGDKIRVIQIKPYILIEILGRSGQAMNLFGEKIPERDLEFQWVEAVGTLGDKSDVEHFFVYPSYGCDGRAFYQWVAVATR